MRTASLLGPERRRRPLVAHLLSFFVGSALIDRKLLLTSCTEMIWSNSITPELRSATQFRVAECEGSARDAPSQVVHLGTTERVSVVHAFCWHSRNVLSPRQYAYIGAVIAPVKCAQILDLVLTHPPSTDPWRSKAR